MQKDFKSWSLEKEKIEKFWKRQVSNWEFWLFFTWVNLWWEMSVEKPFIRHCLILKSNLWWDMILILPISTKIDWWYIKEKFYRKIENFEKYWLNQQWYFVLNQMKIISSKRLLRKISWKQKNWKNFPKYCQNNRLEIKKFISRNIIWL